MAVPSTIAARNPSSRSPRSLVPRSKPIGNPPLDLIPTSQSKSNSRPRADHFRVHKSNHKCIPLTLSATSDAVSEPSERNDLLVCDDILKVLNSALQLEAADRLRGLAGVLEADAEVGAASASALRAGDILTSVVDLAKRRKGTC